jgi:hypothetical protein
LWKLRAQVRAGLLEFAFLLVSLLTLLVSFIVGHAVLRAAGVVWALHGFANLGVFWLKYDRIRCPRCGHNPTGPEQTG